MRRVLAVAVLTSFLLATGGCAAKKLMEKGDAAMLADNPIRARDYYRQALKKDRNLVKKPEFVARMNHISSRAAYAEGKALTDARQWEKAVERFDESRRLDPTFTAAAGAAASSRREAARVRHAQALKFANEGKLSDAVQELRRALELDPDNADAQEALDSVSQQGRTRTGRGMAEHGKAVALQSQRRWARAANAFDAAVKLAPNHLPSRLGAHRARKTIVEARADYERGRKLLAKKKLDDAIAALQESQNTWPFLTEAAQALGEARTQLARANGFYADARKAEVKSDWPASADVAADALAVYPGHRDAAALYERVRGKAADTHARAGAELLAAKRLDLAEAELLKGVRHVADHARSRGLLAEICRDRADWAEGQGGWGASMLWRMDAAEWAATSADKAAIARAAEKIRKRIAFDVSVDVAAAGNVARGWSDDLAAGVLGRLTRRRPDFMGLAEAGGAFAARIRLTELSIEQRRTHSQNRVHAYRIERVEPNPEIPKLKGLLRSAHRELAELRRLYAQPCGHCGGRGRRSARRDGEHGGDHNPTICTYCNGTGRLGTVSDWDVKRKHREVDDLRDALRDAPATVTYYDPAEWPYTIHYHEKAGRIGADYGLTAAGRTVADSKIGYTDRDTDSTIAGANPGVGLQANSLNLVSDDRMSARLLARAADDAVGRIISGCVSDRALDARNRADAAAKAGKTLAAFEARIDRATLLKSISARTAATLMTQLRTGPKPKP